jgi:hypothetical protein
MSVDPHTVSDVPGIVLRARQSLGDKEATVAERWADRSA